MKRFNPCVVPALTLVIVHYEHVVGEDVSETELFALCGLFLRVLGAFDFSLGFRLVESKADPRLGLPYITNSDAHYLWDISEAEHFLEAETCSVRGVFQALKRMCADGGAKEE